MADADSSRLQHRRHTAPRPHLRTVFAGLLVAAAPLLASAASAQQCDPAYGCNPSTTAPTNPAPICSVNVAVVVGGQSATATVVNAAAGAAIQITLDGDPVGSGVADAAGSATIPFIVPTGISPGSHAVFAVGAGFSASCGEVTVEGVGGAAVENPKPGTGGPGAVAGDEADRGVGGGSLARTGIEVALLLAIALVLLLVGRWLIGIERRRRRRRARHRNAVPDLAAQSSAPFRS